MLTDAQFDAVHPHVCGEYLFIGYQARDRGGSSPRVWGIRPMLFDSAITLAVHPHVCGEYECSTE